MAYHFSFTYYCMLGGEQGPNGLSQLAALYLDHSVSTSALRINLCQALDVCRACVVAGKHKSVSAHRSTGSLQQRPLMESHGTMALRCALIS